MEFMKLNRAPILRGIYTSNRFALAPRETSLNDKSITTIDAASAVVCDVYVQYAHMFSSSSVVIFDAVISVLLLVFIQEFIYRVVRAIHPKIQSAKY